MTVKIVCLGDSITFGQFVSPTLRWTTLLARSLADELGPHAVEVENQGLNGETTRGALERFPAAVQASEPDVLLIQYGMNDCNCWASDRGAPRVSVPAFKANLHEMIDRSRRFGVREVVLSTNHRSLRRAGMVSGESYESANARYADAIRDVALESSVRFCDIRGLFSELVDRQIEQLVLPAPDSLHLSEAGHARYAEILRPHVMAALEATAVLGAS